MKLEKPPAPCPRNDPGVVDVLSDLGLANAGSVFSDLLARVNNEILTGASASASSAAYESPICREFGWAVKDLNLQPWD